VGCCTDRVLEGAVGIELLHTATLIHDDVVDSAEKRRGLDTLSIRWGNLAAVLMGDCLFAHALQILVELDCPPVMKAAARTVQALTEGEILEAEQGGDGDPAVYFRIIERKTASLMALSCEVGAILGGGTEEEIASMTNFGKDLGMAFQMTDDLLDYTGDASMMGKPVAQDVREGKTTLPLIRALANCNNGEAETMRERLQRGFMAEKDIQAIVDFVRRYRGIEDARQEANAFANSGLAGLSILNPSPARNALELTLQHVMERKR
jgi:octaprenyl-diphosphate synthase